MRKQLKAGRSLSDAADQLVRAAAMRGSADNTTIILVDLRYLSANSGGDQVDDELKELNNYQDLREAIVTL